MAKTASCPSCGAPVIFRSAASIFAVCEFCQSTLVRHDQALEDIGKMAALVEDRSPLQIGAEGQWQGIHFAIIGRIQLRYSQGLWNEWYILFDDMRGGWLSEAGGEYVVSFLHHAGEPLPRFEELKPGQRFVMASQPWTVTDIEDAECIAGQGELPFKVGPGYKAPVVDLRNGGNFATLDYSEEPPLLFIGAPVDFKSLKMANLRDGMAAPEATVQAQVFRCPACGSPMSARSKEILAVGCSSCGAVVDTGDQNYKLLSKALDRDDMRYAPMLPIGTQGKLDGQPAEVIGFMARRTVSDGIAYDWREYLLAGENGTYRWLTEYNGHWNVVDVLSRHPDSGNGQGDIAYEGQVFKHFANSRAEVIQVEGEFTWRVARGETSVVSDFVAPPLLLSRDRSEREISWSMCRYVEPGVIAQAFKPPMALPEPFGIYANQPNAWEAIHRQTCRRFWLLLLVATLIQMAFAFTGGGQRLLRQELVFTPQGGDEAVVTNTFEVKGRARKLVVTNHAGLDNNWIGLNLTLVNKDTGVAWPAAREISYYYGSDSDGSWSEGSPDDEVVFRAVPPGTYYLAVDPDLAPDNRAPVRDTLEVSSGKAGWSNYVLLLIFLALFPIYTRMRYGAIESGRWAESDHAPVVSDADDADD